MTTRTRRTPEQIHEYQHGLIVERRTAWEGAPRRSGVDRHRRREGYKRWAWTLTGHMHERFHREDS
ncbi:MAG: hypothetical protein ACRDXE_10715 [Acidimicrobiales bacterium]